MTSYPTPSSSAASSGSFSPLPTELLTVIYCHLPSFHDVYHLASTCHRLRHIWLTNIATIYKPVARASIACEPQARNLLADQGGPSPSSDITSIRDVARMMQNVQAVSQAISRFEVKVVSKVRSRGHRAEDYYGAGARRHPPYLTRTERPRFIRAYYRLWGLMSIDDVVERRSRLRSMSLKQLLYLCEISWLPKGMGPSEEAMQSSADPGIALRTESSQCYQARRALSKLVLEQTESAYRRIHGGEMEAIWVIAMDEGYDTFLVMWDHWQSSLLDVVCSRRSKEPPYKKEFHMELWEDSDEEEIERGG